MTTAERVSVDDLMSLVPGRSSAPLQVGAVLMLDVRGGFEPAQFSAELDRRLPRVPRLRQKLVDVPPGCGRPVWVDDADFRIENHLTVLEEGRVDEAAVLELSADLLSAPLPRDRPLWAARLVTEAGRDQAAFIMVFHHVLADGLAGLALLGRLVDGASAYPRPGFPRPRPSRTQLVLDAAAARCRSAWRLPTTVRRVAGAVAELATTATAHATPCSLNQLTGPHRRFAVVATPLGPVRDLAHQHGATVNDVVLVAVARSLHLMLVQRGEHLPGLVVSVPFATRDRADSDELGNHSGVIPLLIPTTGSFPHRLSEVARATRDAKLSPRGASTAVLGPVFRLLARVGLYQRFIDRQRLIHTFVSNLAGPPEAVSLMGCPVAGIIPLSVGIGNVTVAFTILSYAGNLTVTVNADPDTCPELDSLCEALTDELVPTAVSQAIAP